MESETHFCSACLNDFESDKYERLQVNECPKFIGARMNLLDKKKKPFSFYLLGSKTVDVADLKLPDSTKYIKLEAPISNFADFKFPDKLFHVYGSFGRSEAEVMLIANGYYDEEYLQQYHEKDDVSTLWINYHYSYKRRCINLNWLFEEIYGWDWNLNIVIDDYCGFFIRKNIVDSLLIDAFASIQTPLIPQ